MPQASSVLCPKEGSDYVGIDTLQEQTRIKALRRGFAFNLLVAGRSGLGKSTLVNTLFKTNVTRKKIDDEEQIPPTTQVRTVTAQVNEGKVNLRLTLTDTPGFGDNINNLNCWEPIVAYIEEQYHHYLEEEQKIDRPIYIPDTRVHCCLYFIAPTGHSLGSLDIEVLKRLDSIVNVVPVIAKADTLTLEERLAFKERIRADLCDHGIKIYPHQEFEDTEDALANERLRELIPFAVVGGTAWHQHGGKKLLGRKLNWGLVEVENKTHNDFAYLRDMIIRTHTQDLIEMTSRRHYENFRRYSLLHTQKSHNLGGREITALSDSDESRM